MNIEKIFEKGIFEKHIKALWNYEGELSNIQRNDIGDQLRREYEENDYALKRMQIVNAIRYNIIDFRLIYNNNPPYTAKILEELMLTIKVAVKGVDGVSDCEIEMLPIEMKEKERDMPLSIRAKLPGYAMMFEWQGNIRI